MLRQRAVLALAMFASIPLPPAVRWVRLFFPNLACPRRHRLATGKGNTSPMAEFIVTYRGSVYPWHCDHMGHMNVMWYVGKFDEATWQILAAVGATPSRMRAEGFGLVAVEQHIEYKRELCAGDLLTIRSSVLEAREKSVRFVHEMTNNDTGELAAKTLVTGVCIDLAARKARPLPGDILQRIGMSQ